MKCYLGIDIGTTNTKAVCVTEDGAVATQRKHRTPLRMEKGIRFIDLKKLEAIIDLFLEEARAKYRLQGVSFTSIGESVIPVSNGTALSDPLLWYEQITAETARRLYPAIQELAGYGATGAGNDSTLGLYKILWMKEHLALETVDSWLPVSSYFIYRYAGKAVWDYSQAGRSYALDIHRRRWNEELLSRVGLTSSLGTLKYMGEQVAEDGHGLRYFLGGHDHVCGLNFIREYSGGRGFVYDSLGSSAFTVTLAEEKTNELHFVESFMKPNGAIGVGFKERQYYIQNSVRYAGKLLETLARLAGGDRTEPLLAQINRKMKSRTIGERRRCLFLVDGDLVRDSHDNSLSLLNLSIDADLYDLVHSAYLYLCTMTRQIIGRLQSFISGEYTILAGGGLAENSLLMEYKAAILGRPVFLLDVHELSALGAVFCVLQGLGERSVLDKVISNIGNSRIDPDSNLQGPLQEMSQLMTEQYRALKGQTARDALWLG